MQPPILDTIATEQAGVAEIWRRFMRTRASGEDRRAAGPAPPLAASRVRALAERATRDRLQAYLDGAELSS